MPIVTCTLLAVFVVVYACEAVFGLGAASTLTRPSIETLSALGALNWSLVVEKGQWLRIFSATLLHANPLHLLLNGAVLFFVGRRMEKVLGAAWFGAIYAFSAFMGSVFSLLINSRDTLSVGASGAIMGVVAATLVSSFHFPVGPTRKQLQTLSMRILVPSLLPIATDLPQRNVDFAAHIGGALGGLIITLAILRVWLPKDPVPEFRPVAHALVTIAVIGALLAVGSIKDSYARADRELQRQAGLIPAKDLPTVLPLSRANATALVTRYPRDPRSHLLLGNALLIDKDLAGAEREFNAGLAEVANAGLPRDIEGFLRVGLAISMSVRGLTSEAKAVAAPVCKEPANDKLRELVTTMKLCG